MYHCANNAHNSSFIVPPPCAWHLGRSPIKIINFLQQGWFYPYPHFIDEGPGSQGSQVTCSGSQCLDMAEPCSAPRPPSPRAPTWSPVPAAHFQSPQHQENVLRSHAVWKPYLCRFTWPIKGSGEVVWEINLLDLFLNLLHLFDGRAFKIKTGNGISLLST